MERSEDAVSHRAAKMKLGRSDYSLRLIADLSRARIERLRAMRPILLGAVLAAHLPGLMSGHGRRVQGPGWRFELALEALRQPDEMRGWPQNTGPEAMVRLADGRFVILSESYAGWEDGSGHPALLFAQDPAAVQRAVRFRFAGAAGYRPTDMAQKADDWYSEASVARYVRIRALSTVLAQSPSTYYSWEIIMPMRYYTRSDGESGGNATVSLVGRAFYDPIDFTGVFRSTVVNTLTEAELGIAGS